jgi:hypothetical protein
MTLLTPREFVRSERGWLRSQRIAYARHMMANELAPKGCAVVGNARDWWRSVLDLYGANDA